MGHECREARNPTDRGPRAAIGKRITPHESTRDKPGNHHYCFVDFGTEDEAKEVIEALNGRNHGGGRLRVSAAREPPAKLTESHADRPIDGSGRRLDRAPGSHNPGTMSQRALGSSDWRKKEG